MSTRAKMQIIRAPKISQKSGREETCVGTMEINFTELKKEGRPQTDGAFYRSKKGSEWS